MLADASGYSRAHAPPVSGGPNSRNGRFQHHYLPMVGRLTGCLFTGATRACSYQASAHNAYALCGTTQGGVLPRSGLQCQPEARPLSPPGKKHTRDGFSNGVLAQPELAAQGAVVWGGRT